MRFIFLPLLFSVSLFALHAQGYLLPYLQDGKYGIADEEGKILIQPKYDAAIPAQGLYLFKVKQNGLWGFVNMRDELVKPINMADAQPKNRYYFHLHGPTFSRAINKHSLSKKEGPFEKSHLYEIYDGSIGQYYYVNPFVPNSLSGPYLEFYRIGKEAESFQNEGNTGLVRVPMQDKQINFIDTSGNLIFKYGIYDGHAISPFIILMKNEKKESSIYNIREQTQTPFEKQNVQYHYDHKFYLVEKADSSHYTRSSLMNLQGVQLIHGFIGRIYMADNLAILQQPDSTGTIINTLGDTLYTCRPCHLHFEVMKPGWVQININGKVGIIDTLGNTIIEPLYDDLDYNYMKEWVFVRNHTSGVLTKDFQVNWSIDSVEVERFSAKHGLFLLKKGKRDNIKQGMADSLGKVLIPPVFSDLKFFVDDNIIQVRKDTLYSIVNLKGETIIPLMDTMIVVKTKNQTPGHHSSGTVFVYDATQHATYELMKTAPVRLTENKNGEFFLTDLKGNALTPTRYASMFQVHDLTIPRAIFIGKHLGTEEKDVINDAGQSILPYGYTIDRLNDDLVTKGGLVSVYHMGDVKALSMNAPAIRYRTGVVNADGKWVLGPDYQHISIIRQQYIFTSHFDRVEFNLYDQHGKLIAQNSFIPSKESHGNSDLKYNQLVFAKPVDSLAFIQFLNKAKQAKSESELKSLINQFVPKLLEGSLDIQGEEVVPFEYKDVTDFKYPLTTVKSMTGDYSAVVDLNGKEVLRTKYAELKMVDGDSSLVMYREGNLYGLMDIHGKIITPPEFDHISKNTFCNVFVLKDSTSSYTAPVDDIHNRTRIGPKGRVQFYMASKFTYTKVEPDGYKSTVISYHTFDKDMNPMQSFTGKRFSDQFMDMLLPPDYMQIEDSETSKPYVVNIRNGRKFKEEK